MTDTLSRFRVLSFDCYGTLIDWETGIWQALTGLRETGGLSITRHEALEAYAEIEPALQQQEPGLPYPEVLARCHRQLARRLGMPTTPGQDRAFAASIAAWPPFPDSPAALASLAASFPLVILSNVDRDGFAVSAARLGVEFSAVYTAEDIGSYKPDPANFDYLVEKVGDAFDATVDEILHVAQSLFHDHVPAKQRGLATAWIDRQGLSGGGEWGATTRVENPPRPDFIFDNLEALAAAAGAS